jgi:hypothetical protein
MALVHTASWSGLLALALLVGSAPAQVATGTVLGFDGKPVQGAVVSAGLQPAARAGHEVLTDDRGAFEILGAAPLQWLRVQLEGVRIELPLVDGGVRAAQVSFAAAERFTLRGILRTPDGAPAAGIDVLGRDLEGGGLVGLCTDAAGKFVLRCGQPVGELVFDPIGWHHTLPGPFDRDRELVVELRDGPGFFVLQGRVLSAAAPAADELVRGVSAAGRVVTARTRADGGYKLWANFPVDRLEVPLWLSIRRDGPFLESATAVDLDSRVHGCVLVVGRCLDPDGAPVPEALVFALAEDVPVGRGDRALGRTNADGWFQLRLPRGTPFLRLDDEKQWRGRACVAFDGAVVSVRAERY